MTETTIDWIAQRIDAAPSSVGLERIMGGRSNLTSRVYVDGKTSCVLREPPTGDLLATAHDLTREYRVLEALQQADVPVARPLGIRAIDGRTSYLMSYVPGTALPDASALRTWSDTVAVRTVLASSAGTLGRIHRCDHEQIGLAQHGRGGDYVGRQLDRWLTQWRSGPAPIADAIPRLHAQLRDCRPKPRRAALVHGDYHLGNLLLAPDGGIAAVVDWELSTIGDPLADLGTYLAFLDRDLWSWRLSNGGLSDSDRTELAEALQQYGHDSSTADAQLDFYLAWAHWKLACIGEGVLARYRASAMAGDRIDLDHLGWLIRRHAQAADELLASSAADRFDPAPTTTVGAGRHTDNKEPQ